MIRTQIEIIYGSISLWPGFIFLNGKLSFRKVIAIITTAAGLILI